MTPTLRESNDCLDCDYECCPRGKGDEWGTMVFLGLVTIGGVVVFWKHVLVALSFGAVGYGGYRLFKYLRRVSGRR